MFEKHHSPEDRLNTWRNFRNEKPSTIEEVISEFAHIKILDRYLDYYTPKSWPNVFTIVYDGYFCQTGITLLMIATLDQLGFIKEDNLVLPVISNNEIGNTGIVFEHKDCFLNFTPGEIVLKDTALKQGTLFQTHKLPLKQIYS
ncbi:uncharacterized protein METZ01_LOCUS326225 [marine metagenome]|uniref:Uncharacterized protein n=1 Tax=marine metagenome TaxID=408172 RepID=A0A382PN46_9ZZZZ